MLKKKIVHLPFSSYHPFILLLELFFCQNTRVPKEYRFWQKISTTQVHMYSSVTYSGG